MQFLAIVLFAVASSVVYGIIHDQLTIRISLEYFTIGHPKLISSTDPTLLAITWGFVASWWVGLALGVACGIACQVGHENRINVSSLVVPTLRLMFVCGVVASVAGLTGFLLASMGWVYLVGDITHRVPSDKHAAFICAMWSHLASYGVGAMGGIVLVTNCWLIRSTR
jgi:hypothetical protein